MRLSNRNKRALFVLGFFVVGYLLLFQVIFPFYDQQSVLADRIDNQRQALQRALRVLQEQNVYSGQLQTSERVVAGYHQNLLDATDPIAARQQVEEAVRLVAQQTGVRVTRSNPLPERKVGEGYSKVTVQLNLDCDLNELVSFLHALSMHPKFLVVEDFNLASFRVKDQSRIQPRMQVSGFIRLSG